MPLVSRGIRPKNPYSVDLGKDARALLEEYPKRLWRELCLANVLRSCENTHQERLRLLTIRASEGEYLAENSKNTIHQLFWETLEYLDQITTSGWKVIVERHLPPTGSSGLLLTKPMRSWDRKQRNRMFNILLVIGRDTSRNPEKYSDVCPFLALGTLNAVQQKLNVNGGRLNFHVEVARPGTFPSFKEHLRRAKQTHGPRYFQIVHFDLHGMVRTFNDTKVGFLCFSRERSGKTRPILASTVASVLREYEIPFVILNACDSARANSGDDANVASVFQRQGGVRNVLAMSFKISSAAVELFFTSFYQSLLVDRLTFGASSRTARQTLRANMLRPARFGVQRELLDAFVPVLYGPGDDCVPVEDSPQQMSCSENGTPFPSAPTTTGAVSPLLALKPVGRDFDILRLEKLLCESQIVYLHGPSGGGKTSLLQYASVLWQQTRFVDAVVTIDLATEKISSAADFANAILNQLLQTHAHVERSRLWTIPSIQQQSHDLDAIKDIISRVLCYCKVIFIIDGLDMLSSPFRAPLASNSSHRGPVSLEIFEMIKLIVLPSTARGSGKSSCLILAARRLDHEWLGSLLGPVSKARSFELQNLELADSMELSQKILSDAGEDISKWESQDYDWLEAIIGLLQGVPLALKEILPVQQTLSIPWRVFYNRLHGGLFSSLSDLRNLGPYPLLEELCFLSSALPRDCFVLLSLFSCYWGETPPLDVLEPLFMAATGKEVGPHQQRELEPEEFAQWAGPLLAFAADRGYVRIEPDSHIAWVHPLFTIYARAFVPEFNPHLQHSWMRELILKSIQLIPFRWQGAKASPTRGDNDDKVDANELCIKATRCGGDANVLTSIKLCLELSSKIAVDQWPIHLLHIYIGDHSLSVHLGDNLLEFLSLCVERSKTPRDLCYTPLGFCIESVICLLASTRLSTWYRERSQELTHLCINMVQILDQYHGENPDSVAIIFKALLFLVLFVCQSMLGTHTNAPDTNRIARSLKDEIIKDQRQITEWSEKAITDHAADCTNDGDLPIPRYRSQAERLREDLDMLIRTVEAVETPESGQENGDDPEEIRNVPIRQDVFGKVRDKYALGATRAELEEAARCSPLEVVFDPPAKQDVLSPILQELEDATDTGDWTEAFHHHSKLLISAIDNLLFDEADQHIMAIRHISQMIANLNILGPVLDNLKGTVDQRRSYVQLALSLLPSTEGGRRQGSIQVQKELLLLTADKAPLHASLAHTWCNGITAEQGSGGYLPAISRERMLKHMRKYAKRFNSRDSAAVMIARQESFLETLMSAKHAIIEKRFSICFAHLDHLEKMMEKDEWLCDLFEGGDWLEKIRQACQKTQSFFDRVYAQNAAVLDGDFNKAHSIINDISNLDPSDCPGEWTADHLTMMRCAAEQEYLAREIVNAKSRNDFEGVTELHTKYMSNWTKNKFIHIEEVEYFIAGNLEWLLQQSMDTMQWQEGLELCDEGLEYCASSSEETSFQRSQLRSIRESCEAALVDESLLAAEAAADFSACLESLNHLERLWRHQKQSKGQIRQSFLMLSDKLVRLLRCCYEDGCIPCARWARCREDAQLCIFEKRENQDTGNEAEVSRNIRHDRTVFRVAFGCTHHCEGEYCFRD